MEFQTAYGPKKHPVTVNKEPSMTKQSLRDNADINKIIKKYQKTGIVPEMSALEAVYGEITSQDLQEALNKVDASYKAFEQVPSKIRKEFDNDAGKFIDYATNPENIKQLREWGLAPAEVPAPGPVQVEVINPEPPPAE